MLKKIVLGVLFAGLIGVLLYGAINRTVAKTQTGDSGQGTGEVRGNGTGSGTGIGAGGTGQGRGQEENDGLAYTESGGQGNGQGSGQAYAESEITAEDWLSVQGVVTDVNETEMVLDADGDDVLVEGRPWSYALEQGFAAQVGEQVMLHGYYEDGEFKVGLIENATSAGRVQLRTSTGAPMWSGAGRR